MMGDDSVTQLKITDKDFDFGRRYYIAGPMSGYPEYNYPAFQQAKDCLVEQGVTVRSPHEAPWPVERATLSEEELWGAMIRATMKMLLDCNGIIFLKGWTESRGAMLESNVASQLKMPAYFLDGRFLVPMHRGRP